MATTENGIYYPNDGTKAADILTDLELMAKSIDETIGKEVSNNKYDDTKIKQDISDIQKEQSTQNKNIENLQTNDVKQDSLISKLKSAALNAETEEAKSIHVMDASTIGQLEVLGNHEQKTREGYNKYDYLKNLVGSIAGLTVTKDDENGYVIVNGTPEYNYAVISTLVDITDNLEDKQTYTMWAENHYGNNDAGIYLQVRITKISDGTVQYLTTGNVNRTFTVDKSLYTYKANIQIGTVALSGTFNNSKNRFMIYKGTDEKEFELYGATPSPNYPSEVICLGSNKQLFDKITAVEGLLQGDGSLSYSDNNYSTSDFIKVIPKESYYKTITGSSRFKFFDEDKNPISNTYNDLTDPTKAQSFIIPENVHYIRFTFLKAYIDEIKVEKGEQPTSYSPYGQGSTLISKINKNFLNLNNLEVANNNGIDTYSIDNPNQITLKNKSTTSGIPYNYAFQAFHLNLSQGDYNLSAKTKTNSTNYRIIIRGKRDGSNTTAVEVLSQNKNNGNFNIDYSQCDEYTIEFYANQAYVEQLVTTTYYDIQIQKGNTATDYVEHEQTDYILDIQQEMLKGDCFIKEADGWKEVHNIGIYETSENDNWQMNTSGLYFLYSAIKSSNTNNTALSTHFKFNSITSGMTSLADGEFALQPQYGNNPIYCRDNSSATLQDFKNRLATEKVKFYYNLVNPTKLPCTEAQSAVLEELNNLDLFEGVNNIITAEDIALLKLKYALDVKTYVNNQLANVNAQILNIAGGN